MAEFWFIRHFRTPWNAEGRLQGRRDIALDDPLCSNDHTALVNNLSALEGMVFAEIWTSPLQRTRQTAALHGYPTTVAKDALLELDFGPWEGRTWTELHAAHPGLWSAAPDDLPLGESFVDFERRVTATLHNVWNRSGAPVLVFGHGAWANCAQAVAAGTSAARMNEWKTPNGALIRIRAKIPRKVHG
ncbi:histidine phosphatase family protein [Roseinatronobacter alkalisoli]|uniref:Histidine phosphatase family protein n=1 Tax=Roseinatronobacter alkalisoli TaxID=3028235 RepID=A0ABT5TA03_9RHOB|nr:histidine phosphatase family protein [Roseinatronobacter sp. HJB301]MDD7971933.1 histidine phosphatase family protein [Roseinatronobacter sp. HJB301]